MDWEAAFEGPLSRYLESDGRPDSVRVPWPAIEDADRDLADLVLEDPDNGLKGARSALSSLGYINTPVRVYELPERRTYRVGKYGSSALGELIGVTGEVVDVGMVKPCAREAAFECQLCGTLTRVPQSGGDLLEPGQCQGCEQSSAFRFHLGQSEVVDFQRIELQRTDSSMDDPPVEVVFLWEDLCETVSAGDVVTIVGTYDILPDQDEAVLETYLDAVSINKSEQPATVDEVADWKVRKWTFDAVDRLSTAGSSYDTATREVIDTVSDEHGVAEGEIQAALDDLEGGSLISEHRDGRVHITTSSTPTFEPDC
ncbi:replication control protein Cdc46 (plasmid) [Halobiforma lacisalsi AJ5]|uniref:DNA helicase n=1 Tax=Natronobacterium lacisalsi AJ5 TaxID=358396 RepID=A0A1P8LWM3_NATLA|nr:minichromosome maintenance protein MCM [Halobiforma lacisalsi]APX00189.1 replication control protein Cdc46 [Halobiforma lacisalsi AJ5]